MSVNPLVVQELRDLFVAGTTPSALVRHILKYHPVSANIDVLVRAYFREAFRVPMMRIGPEQIGRIARGDNLPEWTAGVLRRMIQTRDEWHDRSQDVDSWMNNVDVTDESTLIAAAHPELTPELAESWERMDKTAKEFIRRLFGNARSLLENSNALAALAEHLQKQLPEENATLAQSA